METGQRLRLAKVVGDGGVNRWSTQNSVGSKTTLNGTKLVGVERGQKSENGKAQVHK